MSFLNAGARLFLGQRCLSNHISKTHRVWPLWNTSNTIPVHRSPSLTIGRFLSSLSSSSTPKATEEKPKNLPLKGITVVSLEQAIAAPFCTRQLADLGARVIKIERPGAGDFARSYDTRVAGQSSHFVWTNRSKESLALDLKNEQDLGILRKLLSRTDVLVQNLAPGATDRLGLSYRKLCDEFPRLIVCDISGYGDSGPYRDRRAYDLLVQSEAGLLSVTGTEDGRPVKVGISIADIAAGMYALTNILAALMRRSKTGKGARIDLSMLECMAEWMTFPLYYTYQNQPPPKPVGASHATIFPYGPFEIGSGKDGEKPVVLLAVQNEREWARLCADVLEDPSLATNPRFVTNAQRSVHRAELTAVILDKFGDMSLADVVARLDGAGIAYAHVNDVRGLWEHPQLRARGRWTEVALSDGTPVPALLPPGVTGGAEGFGVEFGRIPAVGEHNAAILAELGVEGEDKGAE